MVSGSQLPELIFAFASYLALSAIGFSVLYWVIRLAVRHALEDAERRHPSRRG